MDVRPAAMPPHLRYITSEGWDDHGACEQDWASAGKEYGEGCETEKTWSKKSWIWAEWVPGFFQWEREEVVLERRALPLSKLMKERGVHCAQISTVSTVKSRKVGRS
jgi:hypothetical protein